MALSPEQRKRSDEETLYAMAGIFCRANHANAPKGERGLCAECQELIDYSIRATEDCPFGHEGNCEDCEIHCYKPGMRERIREIMRFAAPRMMYSHPILSARYLRKKLAGKRKAQPSE